MVFIIFLAGLIIGSFINAAVWRIHEEKPLAKDRSECPRCGRNLQAKDLVPVLSWMRLRGKCRYCSEPISIQYPLVELLTAVLFMISYLRWDFTAAYGSVLFAVWLIVLTALIILAVYDLKWMLLPNKVMLPLLLVSALYVATLSFDDISVLQNHLIAAVIFGGSTYLLYQLSKGKWVGGGDVKLLFVMGLLLGVQDAFVAFLLAVYSGALVSIALLLTKKRTRKDLVPFGPFLIGGVILALLFGDIIVDWYFDFFFSV